MVKTAFLNNFYPCRTLYVSVSFFRSRKDEEQFRKKSRQLFSSFFCPKNTIEKFFDISFRLKCSLPNPCPFYETMDFVCGLSYKRSKMRNTPIMQFLKSSPQKPRCRFFLQTFFRQKEILCSCATNNENMATISLLGYENFAAQI